MLYAAPAFVPIFGSGLANRYTSAPLYVIAQRDRHSIVTFAQFKKTPLGLTDSLADLSELRPPMAFTALKTEREDYINHNRLIRTRARKKIDIYPELHPVH